MVIASISEAPLWEQLVFIGGGATVGFVGFCAIIWLVEEKRCPKSIMTLLFFSVLAILRGLAVAWGNSQFIIDFALESIAGLFFSGVFFAGGAAGYFVWAYVSRRSKKEWLAWSLGIAVGLSALGGLIIGGTHIPGLGWRLKIMLKEGPLPEDRIYDSMRF